MVQRQPEMRRVLLVLKVQMVKTVQMVRMARTVLMVRMVQTAGAFLP